MAGSTDPKAAPRTRAATIVAREDLTPTLAIFRFELEGGVPPFEAGQFVPLGVQASDGSMIWRPYSIASPPGETRFLELYIRLVEQPPDRPHLTRELWALGVGAQVWWKRPRGGFTLAETHADGTPDTRRLLLVGGGTGLAPFVSMAVHARATGEARPIVVCHGASYRDELGYRELFEQLQAESAGAGGGPPVHYLNTVSRPDDPRNADWDGHVGRVETLLARGPGGEPSAVERAMGEELRPSGTCAYVCGFEGTVVGALAALEPLGFRTRREPRPDGSYDVYTESYG